MDKSKGRAKVIPANPDAIFLPYQANWIKDSPVSNSWKKAARSA